MTTHALELGSLRAAVTGDVITPQDAGWDTARAAWNLLADQRPALIVQAADARDVVEAVRFARASGLRVAAQGTGHHAGALAPLSGTLLVRTERMNGVTIDPADRRPRPPARARSGAT